MAKRKVKRPDGSISPVLRPLAWSAVLGAAAAAAFAAPAYAEPTPNTIPDAGSRPAPAGSLQLPGATAPPAGSTYTPPPSVTGPLATQIYNAEVELGLLSEDLLKKREEQAQARTDLAVAHRQLEEARVAVANAEASAESAAAQAIKEAAELPPGAFGSDLHALSELSRIQRGEDSTAGSDTAEREVARAKDAERVAQAAYNTALAKEQTLAGQFSTLEATLKSKEAALQEFKERNAAQLAVIEREREANEAALGAGFLNDETIAGMAAHPQALKAVDFALGELGKPYVWGAEGPNAYDCSGLMLAAYLHAGYRLPRVSRDQYAGTRSRLVPKEALLPGDLVFFSSNGTASGIHHVGMYIGDGKMVHSPNSREKVKVSTVWWSRFFAATRIFGAVPAPTTPPPTTPPPTPKPTTKPPATKPPTTKPPATTKPPTTPPATTKPPTTPPTTPPPTTATPTSTPNPSTTSAGEPSASASATDTTDPNTSTS
jgi:cell wall-associated NlpC family hydrolase